MVTQLEEPVTPPRFRIARQRFERAYVDYLMRIHNHSKPAVAKALGISLSSVKDKTRKGFGGRP